MLWLSTEALPCCQPLGKVSESSVCCLIHSQPEAKKKGWIDFFCADRDFIFLLEFTHCINTKEGVSLCVPCVSLLTAGCAQWVRVLQRAVHATFYLVLEFPMSFMPYRVMYYMYLQERAGRLSIDVWMCIIAAWNCLYNKIKRESTKCTKRRGKRRQSEG